MELGCLCCRRKYIHTKRGWDCSRQIVHHGHTYVCVFIYIMSESNSREGEKKERGFFCALLFLSLGVSCSVWRLRKIPFRFPGFGQYMQKIESLKTKGCCNTVTFFLPTTYYFAYYSLLRSSLRDTHTHI